MFVCVCVCVRGGTRKKREKRRIHAQKLLAVDFRKRPSVTDAYGLIYINLY